MKAGISTACLYPGLLEECVEDLLGRGVDCMEIFFNSHCELEDDYTAMLKKRLDDYGSRMISLHPFTCPLEPMMFFTPYERRFLDILEYYKKYFEVMRRFGAEVFVFHGNKPANPFPNDDYFDRFYKLTKVGEEFGITVGQENVSRCVSGKLDFLKEMAVKLGRDAHFVLDIKQARRGDGNPFDYLEALGEKICHIHYSDADDNNDCMQFGDGTFDNDGFFRKLAGFGFKGTVILELYRKNYENCDTLCENYRLMKNELAKY